MPAILALGKMALLKLAWAPQQDPVSEKERIYTKENTRLLSACHTGRSLRWALTTSILLAN